MKMSQALPLLTAAIMLSVCSSVANGQGWGGGYVGAQVGASRLPAPEDASVRFDKNLDGDFSDTILTAAGANAFSPGFCAGAAATALPAAGCTEERTGLDIGVRAGYDWNAGGLVVGALGELAFPDHVDSTSAFSTTPAFYTFTREVKTLGSVRGRVGFGGNRALIYGTGGLAWGRLEHSFTTSNTANTFVEEAKDNSWGYQVGGGIEFMAGRLTVGAEYLITDLMDEDRHTVRARGPAPATNPFILTNASGTDLRRSDSFMFQAIRATVGYRF
ncbi:MAG: outer membrane protein [Vicinamibacterales bacterium]